MKKLTAKEAEDLIEKATKPKYQTPPPGIQFMNFPTTHNIMNAITTTLLLALCTMACHAAERPAMEIARLIETELFPIPPDPRLAEDDKGVEMERRKQAREHARQAVADRLEKQLTPEELQQALAFLRSPAGRKFQATINGQPLLDEINGIARGQKKEAAGAPAGDVPQLLGSWKHVSTNGDPPPVQSTITFQADGKGFVEIARNRGKKPLKLNIKYALEGKSLVITYTDEELAGQQERATFFLKDDKLEISGMNQGAADQYQRVAMP